MQNVRLLDDMSRNGRGQMAIRPMSGHRSCLITEQPGIRSLAALDHADGGPYLPAGVEPRSADQDAATEMEPGEAAVGDGAAKHHLVRAANLTGHLQGVLVLIGPEPVRAGQCCGGVAQHGPGHHRSLLVRRVEVLNAYMPAQQRMVLPGNVTGREDPGGRRPAAAVDDHAIVDCDS